MELDNSKLLWPIRRQSTDNLRPSATTKGELCKTVIYDTTRQP